MNLNWFLHTMCCSDSCGTVDDYSSTSMNIEAISERNHPRPVPELSRWTTDDTRTGRWVGRSEATVASCDMIMILTMNSFNLNRSARSVITELIKSITWNILKEERGRERRRREYGLRRKRQKDRWEQRKVRRVLKSLYNKIETRYYI